jgi:cobyrinic acid a,c-diamide synthase
VGSSNARRPSRIHPGDSAVVADDHPHSPRYPTPDPSPQGGGGLAPLGHHIAVARDVAFAFAYPHILDDWRAAGAAIRFFSPLTDEPPPSDADAVFLPGGYPELHAGRIAAAEKFRTGMEAARARGALIYGECGGYMVLGDALIDGDSVSHKMLGFLPLVTSFATRKLHLGYRRLTPLGGLPWDVPLAAHEFHFATIVSSGDGEALFEATSADGQSLGPIGHVISSGGATMISQDDAQILHQDRPRISRAGIEAGRVMGSFAHVIGPLPARDG